MFERIGEEAFIEDVPDRITLTGNGRTVTLRRVELGRTVTSLREGLPVPNFRQTFEAYYGIIVGRIKDRRDTDLARAMFIDRHGATVDVTLSPRGNTEPPNRPPDRIRGGFLHSGWPSVRWEYTRSPRLMVSKSLVRFRRDSDDPWKLGPVIDLDLESAGRNTFPSSYFGPGGTVPWGAFTVQVRTAYDYGGNVQWSDWSRSYRFEYLPPPPELTPERRRLRVEIRPQSGYGAYEVRYRTYRQGGYFHHHSGSLDLGSRTTGIIPGLRGGAGYTVQARYIIREPGQGDIHSPWSESALATPLRSRQTVRFTAVFVTEWLDLGADGVRDTAEERESGTGDDRWRAAGRTRGEGFGPSQRAWPDSRFSPTTYEHNRQAYSVTSFQWGNEQGSFSPSILGRNDLIIRGEGHYSRSSLYPFSYVPIPDDDFELVINGLSYGRTEPLYWSRWNSSEWTTGVGYVRGIRGAAGVLRANVPLNTPVAVEFRYSAED